MLGIGSSVQVVVWIGELMREIVVAGREGLGRWLAHSCCLRLQLGKVDVILYINRGYIKDLVSLGCKSMTFPTIFTEMKNCKL